MGNRYHATIEQSKRDKAFFAIIEAIIKNCDRRALKHFLNSNEINTVITEIGFTFCLVPFKLYE